MKRLLAILCMLAMAFLGAAGTAGAQSTASESVTAANCQHNSGDGVVVSAAYVKRWDGVNIGAIQLCKNSTSPYYWAYIVFYSPLPTATWGEAYLSRYYAGESDLFMCESPGGNNHVAPGQTWCASPKIYAPSSKVTFMASGVECEGHHPTCNFRNAVGHTARTR